MSLSTQSNDVLSVILSFLSLKDVIRLESSATKFSNIYKYKPLDRAYIRIKQLKYELIQSKKTYLEALYKDIKDTKQYNLLKKWSELYKEVHNQNNKWSIYEITKDDWQYNNDFSSIQFYLWTDTFYLNSIREEEEHVKRIGQILEDFTGIKLDNVDIGCNTEGISYVFYDKSTKKTSNIPPVGHTRNMSF